MPDASVTLGLDAREFDARLAALEQKITQFGSRAGRGFAAAGEGSERLIRSSHRAAASIHGLAASMAAGGDAATVLGSGIEALGRMLNINLGALAGIAIGAVIVQQLYKAQEEMDKTKEKLRELEMTANTPSEFKSLTDLKTHLKEVQGELEKLRDPSIWQWILRWNEATKTGSLAGAAGAAKEALKSQKEAAEKTQATDYGQIAGKMSGEADEAELGSQDKYHSERMKLLRERREKLGEVANEFKDDQTGASKQALDAVNREFDARKEMLDHTHAEEQRSLELQKKLLEIKQQGGDVELNSAAEKVKAAEKELQLATQGDKAKAELKLQEAGLALKELVAKRTPAQVSAAVATNPYKFGTFEHRAFDDDNGPGSIKARNNETGYGSMSDRWNPMAAAAVKAEDPNAAAFKTALGTAEGYLKDLLDKKVLLVNK